MEEVRQNENSSNSDAYEGEKNQHDAVDENNVSNGNHTETSLSQSPTRTSFSPGPIFSQIRDGIHSAFSGKSFHLPHWWDSGASRFFKLKRNGVTYAVLLGKTLDDMPYCFRVRRDESEKKAFFTPMAIYAANTTSTSPSAVEVRSPESDIKVVELETLPDIVTYERGKFRAGLKQIFEEAGESYTPERLEELVKDHAEEGMEFLVAFRALHPPVHFLPMKEEETPEEL
ncbi:hypothetical protein LSM04_006353 [Trypanosoma melophagium]|uniref:uncharacterized protein n=1 Tax=Trypanosoma melophagium TaxID=715481 RepID=UPI00351AAF8A|nr:hypothetical protein LSM04_006353 [Trypanosoma melophagium]